MISVFTKTVAFAFVASTGMVLDAASCPSQWAAVAGPRNTPIIRFAIVGLVDIDKDGKSDIDLIRRIIEQGGGTIDAEISIDGEQTGRLQRITDYLVLGTLPDKTATSPMLAQRLDALLVLLPERLGSPEWLPRTLCVAFGVGIVPAFAFFYFRTSQNLSRQHRLLCSRCGRALRKLFLRRRRPADPDYCVDGEVPLRCPHCHAPIDIATDKRTSSN